MTKELIKKEKSMELVKLTDLPTLPVQVLAHFPDASEDDKVKLALSYSGSKMNPSFPEWLESYQQSELFRLTVRGTAWVKRLQKNLSKYMKNYEKDKDSLDEDELKKCNKEIHRQLHLINSISGQHLDLTKELNKLVQNNLSREQPRKVEMTQITVTPSDVANLINKAKQELNTINVTKR